LNGKISLSLELQVNNGIVFAALKRAISNASQQRKLDIVYNHSRDPRCKLSIIAHSFEAEME